VKLLSTIVAAIVLGLASTQVCAENYNFKPGLWETTTTMEVKGVPAEMEAMMKMPSQTEQECIKENELIFISDDKCKYEKKRVSAKKLLVNITCTTPEGVIKGTGEVNFNGKTSSGWFEMDVPQGPSGPMKMKSIFNAKYIGACK
jgi:hypothetical protein